jgi:hypothetical protein
VRTDEQEVVVARFEIFNVNSIRVDVVDDAIPRTAFVDTVSAMQA